MKKLIIILAIFGITCAVTAISPGQAQAETYIRKGSIHLPAQIYGPEDGFSDYANVTENLSTIAIVNRSDAAITVSIDYWRLDTGTLVVSDAAPPAPWADGVIDGHAAAKFQTNNLPELSGYTNVWLAPVIKWSGNVGVAPVVFVQAECTDDSGNLATIQYLAIEK